MLDPKQFPKLMLLSLLASLAIGALVWRWTGNPWAAGAVTLALLAADWFGLRDLMK